MRCGILQLRSAHAWRTSGYSRAQELHEEGRFSQVRVNGLPERFSGRKIVKRAWQYPDVLLLQVAFYFGAEFLQVIRDFGKENRRAWGTAGRASRPGCCHNRGIALGSERLEFLDQLARQRIEALKIDKLLVVWSGNTERTRIVSFILDPKLITQDIL